MATCVNGSAGEMGRGGCLVEKSLFGSLNPPRPVSNTFRRMRNVVVAGYSAQSSATVAAVASIPSLDWPFACMSRALVPVLKRIDSI